MTPTAYAIGAIDELDRVNRELANLLRTDPAKLTTGAEAAFKDELVICGILGGKDVGKSTLINALAKTNVSVDRAEVGRGTEKPAAYVHQDMREALRNRLEMSSEHVPLDITAHTAEAIRNVVLVDMPDFDSEFLNHLDTVRTVAPLLDRILWVLTPRKIGDRAWVQMLRETVKDAGNVHCVLNKVDELLADGEPFGAAVEGRAGHDDRRAARFWHEQHQWVAQLTESVGCPRSENHRFLVAAAFPDPQCFTDRIGVLWNDPDWGVYAVDRSTVAEVARLASQELDRLRSCVLAPLSEAERQAVKTANQGTERRANVTHIRRHYDLDLMIERLERACDPQYVERVLDQAVGAEYYAAIAAAIQNRLRPDADLADELLDRRVGQWPLLRLAHWPLGWLSRIVGRRVVAERPATTRGGGDSLDVERRILVDRVDLARSRILADHAVIAHKLGIDSDLPSAANLADRVVAAVGRVPGELEVRLIGEIRQSDGRPSPLAKAMLWFILLWFPIAQPVLSGVLEIYAESSSFQFVRGLYRIVSALSAAHLLVGFALVAGVYAAILAGMYVRCLRAVRRGRDEQSVSSPVAEAVDGILVSEVAVPLVRPFQDRLDRLNRLVAVTAEVEASADTAGVEVVPCGCLIDGTREADRMCQAPQT